MLTALAQFEEFWGPLRLFRFLSFRSIGGAVTALFVGMMIAPVMIAWLKRVKLEQSFRVGKHYEGLKEHAQNKRGTPTMGGLIVFVAVLVSTILWVQWNVYVVCAMISYAGLTLIGFLDDMLKVLKKNSDGLAGRYKLAGQGLITLSILLILLRDPLTSNSIRELWLPFFKEPIWALMPIPVVGAFLFFVLSGTSNAINLTDGIDGLAIGCTLTVAMTFGLMAYASGNGKFAEYLLLPHLPGAGELAVICAILCAASLAFLWHNAHPASIFMGDTGSLALGGLVGIIAFLILQPFTLVIVGGVFVAEALSVILQVSYFKATGGKRIFRMAPIHHHFEKLGWKEPQIVIRFWILSLLCAIAGLATLKLR